MVIGYRSKMSMCRFRDFPDSLIQLVEKSCDVLDKSYLFDDIYIMDT